MEAAAALGFKHVCPAVVDACLAQIRCKPGRTVAQRAGALIDAYKDEWGWSQVDCARALMHVLPGQKHHTKRKGPSDMTGEGPVWEDLPSLVEALKVQQVQAQSTQEQPEPATKAKNVDPLVQAIIAIEGAPILHIHPSKPKLPNNLICVVYACVSVFVVSLCACK